MYFYTFEIEKYSIRKLSIVLRPEKPSRRAKLRTVVGVSRDHKRPGARTMRARLDGRHSDTVASQRYLVGWEDLTSSKELFGVVQTGMNRDRVRVWCRRSIGLRVFSYLSMSVSFSNFSSKAAQ